MPDVNIKITNLPQIQAAFKSAPTLMVRHFTKAIQQSTFLIEGESKIRTPVDTGYLRYTTGSFFEGGGIGFKGIVYPAAHYAGFVHEGTRFMKGRPFLKQAVDSSVGRIDGLFNTAMQNVLNDIGRAM